MASIQLYPVELIDQSSGTQQAITNITADIHLMLDGDRVGSGGGGGSKGPMTPTAPQWHHQV